MPTNQERLTANNAVIDRITATANTLPDGMKSYISVAAMNADIANINTNEVVKVVSGNNTTYYMKEAGSEGTYQPLDLTNYVDGDTISLKGKKLATSFTAVGASDYVSGEGASLSFNNNGTSVLTIEIAGGTKGPKGYVHIGEDTYSYTLSDTETFTLSAADVETINSESFWNSDTTLTISEMDISVINGAILSLQGATSPIMRELIPNVPLSNMPNINVELGSTTFYSYTLPTINGVNWENAAATVRPRVKLYGENEWHYTEWYDETADEDRYMPYIYGGEYENQFIYYDDTSNEYKLGFTLDVEASSYLTTQDTVEVLVDIATLDGTPAHADLSVTLTARTYISYRIQLLKANGDIFVQGDTMPTAELGGESVEIKDRTRKNEGYWFDQNIYTDNILLEVEYDNTTTDIQLPVTSLLANHQYNISFQMILDGQTHTVPTNE